MATWSVKYRLAPPNDAKLRSIHVEADNPLRAVNQAEARIPSDALVLGYRMGSGEFVACDSKVQFGRWRPTLPPHILAAASVVVDLGNPEHTKGRH